MSKSGSLLAVLVVLTAVGAYYYFDKEQAKLIVDSTQRHLASLGIWALPAYITVHTLAITGCFPYALAFEAGAGLLFGLWKGIICVMVAKTSAASLSFWLGRLVFRNWDWLTELVKNNRYFGVVREGVARDGWKFVLLARFSPLPSYFINYALALTDIRYFQDFLLPTLAGGIPMIVQNTSLGSLTATIGLSLSSMNDAEQQPYQSLIERVTPYAMPTLGIICSIWLTWRVRSYTRRKTSLGDVAFSPEEEVATLSEGASLGRVAEGVAWNGTAGGIDHDLDRPAAPNLSEGANSVSSPEGGDSFERERDYEVTSPVGRRTSNRKKGGVGIQGGGGDENQEAGWGGGFVSNGILSPRNVGDKISRAAKPAGSSPKKGVLSPKAVILSPKGSTRKGRPRKNTITMSEDASSKISLSTLGSSPMTRARARAMALALAAAEQQQQRVAEPWS